MSYMIGILVALVSIATTCTSLPDLHKRMSAQQLQSVFHVDDINAVPHYEVVQLLHHNSADGIDGVANVGIHRSGRRRRSINVIESVASGTPKESHHVKKDLSKNLYYSELKKVAAAAAAADGRAANSLLDSAEPNKMHFDANFADVSNIKEHNVSFSAFGENLNLTLRPTKGLFKDAPHKLRMWTVHSEPNATHGLDLQEVFDESAQSSEQIGEVFQDEENMAAILMRRHGETGDLVMEGSIGHEMVIKPVPHELSPNKEQAHHIIYKREAQPLEHLSDFAFMEPDDLRTSEKLEKLQRRQKRSANLDDTAELTKEDEDAMHDELTEDEEEHTRAKRQAPYIIYPEVLVIVDYDGYRLHGGDNLQVKRYFISFWNGVDLRYRLLKGPRIRISIAGIIISRGRDATPYLERNRVGRDAIDSAAALTDMGKYLFRERRLPVYDIAVAITKYDMCRRRKGGRCTKGTAGFAYVGGACVVNKRLEKVNSVAIIEDTGGFSGIIVAAHEVGHLLGAVHDGSPPPSYLGGPGAQRCRWEDGYIMSDLRHTERGFRWSPCTVQSFHHFLNGDTATCLHNAPHEDGALGRSLPGTLLSLDAQCRRDRGTYACFKDERVCAQLFCFDAQTGYCVAYRPAAEGSSCGNGLHCLDGRCAPLPTNAINYGPPYRVVYKNNNAANSAENNDNISSEEDDDDEEDESNAGEEEDDIENDNKSSEEENEVQKPHKLDNSVEETLLELKDEQNKTIHTTHTTEDPIQTTPKQIQTKFDTFEYLTRILENKEWSQLLRPNGTTPITTTKPTVKPYSTIAEQELMQRLQLYGGVVVKTSTTSSVSSSTGSKNVNKTVTVSNSCSVNCNCREQKCTDSNEIIQNKQEIVERQNIQTHIPFTTTTTTTTTTTPIPTTQIQTHNSPQNFFKFYTTEFRKQFHYYLNLLQKSNSNYSNRNVTKLQKQTQSEPQPPHKQNNTVPTTKTTKVQNQESTKNSINSNYSETTNINNNGNPSNENAEGSNVPNISNYDDDENEASNEAIVKQKRKFDAQISTTTTAKQQQPLKLLQQYTPPTPAITTTTAGALPTVTRSNLYGGRAAQRSHSFLDAYFKKLQALQAQQAAAAPAPPSALPPTVSVSTTITSTTASQQQQALKEADNFATQFLKLVNFKAFPF
ncbi:uncharacterized protein LOC119685179 isoform X2 [Teleopsis dalmanni]|uniref:uncharacterized protein LOC119685179 isoform X2 n=1 Tax=Teleopsis dalmanni TaxID=139649 RepID=UPI0018CEF550|nr:uncharacterized protein LOC119685179 isoform X2 [Teleopsis dalmanni]